jgi:hypothetical protein
MTTDLETASRTIVKTYTLTVVANGNARGNVSADDGFGSPRIACSIRGSQTSGVCTSEYPAGQTASLSRSESVTSIAQFIGWSCGEPGVNLFIRRAHS